MTTVLYAGIEKQFSIYKNHFYNIDPEINFIGLSSTFQRHEIDFILYSIAGDLNDFSGFLKLKAIISLWAGIDAILEVNNLPEKIPIIKMEETGLTIGMSDYVVGNVFRLHLNMLQQQQDQSKSLWVSDTSYSLSINRKVGVFGLGPLGTDVVKQLALNRFNVSAWSRTFRSIDNVTCFSGFSALPKFFSRCEILVLLAPATIETKDIINKKTLAMLPYASSIINAARGALIQDQDLLDSLDKGHIKTAILDVFKNEPLDKKHPFWLHPNIIITPHCASVSRPETASVSIINTIHNWQQGTN